MVRVSYILRQKKYQVGIINIAKVMTKVNVLGQTHTYNDRRTHTYNDRQTDRTNQYTPDHSIRGHKTLFESRSEKTGADGMCIKSRPR